MNEPRSEDDELEAREQQAPPETITPPLAPTAPAADVDIEAAAEHATLAELAASRRTPVTAAAPVAFDASSPMVRRYIDRDGFTEVDGRRVFVSKDLAGARVTLPISIGKNAEAV